MELGFGRQLPPGLAGGKTVAVAVGQIHWAIWGGGVKSNRRVGTGVDLNGGAVRDALRELRGVQPPPPLYG